ncbi:MAG: alpha/beta hydrolase, partial [Dehalococcoidia bacterium]
DMRGNGASSDADDYSYEALASDIHAVVEHCDLVAPLVVGHSWGGQLAVCYASRHTCGGVVGIDGWITDVSTELGDDVWRSIEESYAEDPFLRFVGTADELAHVLREVQRLYGDSAVAVAGRQFVECDDGLYRWRRSVPELVAIQRTIDREGVVLKTDLYASIQCPVLLIGGEHSPGDRDPRLGPWGFSRDATVPIAERFPNVQCVWWPCGHDIPHEMPRQLAQTLKDFATALP